MLAQSALKNNSYKHPHLYWSCNGCQAARPGWFRG